MENKVSSENRPVVFTDTFISSDASLTPRKRRGELQEEAEELRTRRVNHLAETAGTHEDTDHCENLDIFTSPFQALAESCGFKVIREDEDSDSDIEGKNDKYTHDNNRATTVGASFKTAEKCLPQPTAAAQQAVNSKKGNSSTSVYEVSRQFHNGPHIDDNESKHLDKKRGHSWAIVRPNAGVSQGGDGEKPVNNPSIHVLGLESRFRKGPLIDHLDLSQNYSTTQVLPQEQSTQSCQNLGWQKSSKSAFKPTSSKCDVSAESFQNHLIPGPKGKIFLENQTLRDDSKGNERCFYLNKQNLNEKNHTGPVGRVKEAVKTLETMNKIRSRGRAMRSSFIQSPPSPLVTRLERDQRDSESLERREILQKLAQNGKMIQKMREKSRTFGLANTQTKAQKTNHLEGSKSNEDQEYNSEEEKQNWNENTDSNKKKSEKVGTTYTFKDYNTKNKKPDVIDEFQESKMRHAFSYSDIPEESKHCVYPPSKSESFKLHKQSSPWFPFNRDNKLLLKQTRSANGLVQHKQNGSAKSKKVAKVEEIEPSSFEFKEKMKQGVEHRKTNTEGFKIEVSPGVTTSGSAQAIDTNVNLCRESSCLSDRRHQDYKRNINSNYEDDVDEDMPASAFIGQYLYELWKNQCLCDVRLRVGNKSYLAHKLVLAAFSDVFCPNEPQKTPSLCFDIPNTTPDAVYQILMYLYTSEMELTDGSLECVLCAAAFMGVTEIVNLITEILAKPNIDNFEHYMEIRKRQGMSTNLLDFPEIVRDNLLELTDSSYFLELKLEDFETLLQDPEIKVESEADIITCLAKWIEYNPFKRTKSAARLLGYVNFDSLDPEVLSDIVDQMRHLFDLDAIAVLMEAFKKHALNHSCGCAVDDESRTPGGRRTPRCTPNEDCQTPSRMPSARGSATDVEPDYESNLFSNKSFNEIRDSFAAKRHQERCTRSPIRKNQTDCETPDNCKPITSLGENCKPFPIFQDTCKNRNNPQDNEYYKPRRQVIDMNKSNLGFSRRSSKKPQFSLRDTSKSPDSSRYSPGQGLCSSGSSRCSSFSGNQKFYEDSDKNGGNKSGYSNNNQEASSYSNSRGSESDSERRSPCVYRIQSRNMRYKDQCQSCGNTQNKSGGSNNRPYVITPCYKRSQSSDRLNGRRARGYFDSIESPRKYRRPRSASVSPASSRRFSSSDKSSAKRVTFR